jgi:hypothetical protein
MPRQPAKKIEKNTNVIYEQRDIYFEDYQKFNVAPPYHEN